jgi:hypothetical protein
MNNFEIANIHNKSAILSYLKEISHSIVRIENFINSNPNLDFNPTDITIRNNDRIVRLFDIYCMMFDFETKLKLADRLNQ